LNSFTISNGASSPTLEHEAHLDGASFLNADDACQTAPTMTDAEREEAIARAGAAMQSEYAAYKAADARRDVEAATTHLNRAYRHLEQQRELVAGRSREQVQRMEAERGLR